MRWYLHGAEGSQIYWISSPVKLFTSSKWTDISIGIRQLTSSSDLLTFREKINKPVVDKSIIKTNIYFPEYLRNILIFWSMLTGFVPRANRVMCPDIDFLFSMSEIARPRQPNYLKKQEGSQLISTFHTWMNILLFFLITKEIKKGKDNFVMF